MKETIITISLSDKYVNMLYQMKEKYKSSICDLIKEAIREYYRDEFEHMKSRL